MTPTDQLASLGCKHYFVIQDLQWQKCAHCGLMQPILYEQQQHLVSDEAPQPQAYDSNTHLTPPFLNDHTFEQLNRSSAAQQEIAELKRQVERLEEKNARLKSLINRPELDDFIEGFKIEAAHQTERWGETDEELKPPHHYILVYNKLLGKLAVSVFDRNEEKFRHHLITLAASGFNCFRQIQKEGTEVNAWFASDRKANDKTETRDNIRKI